MGFGTTLYTGIYFHDENYDNVIDVQNRINEVKAIINNYKERMKMYAVCTEPKKFFKDEKDIFLAIHNKIDEYFEILEEYYIELYKLELLLNKWESCHDKETGYGKLPDPEQKLFSKSFIRGDFINGIYPDGKIYDYRKEIL